MDTLVEVIDHYRRATQVPPEWTLKELRRSDDWEILLDPMDPEYDSPHLPDSGY